MPGSRDWSDVEIDLIVADYFGMLGKELSGERYNKSAHRQALRKLLNGRSDGSIERKHQNISAILREAKFPWIDGYKPLSNYQARLAEAVLERLDDDGEQNLIALRMVEASPQPRDNIGDLLDRMTPAPSLLDSVREALDHQQRARVARRIDYLAREARNSQLGRAGEEFVVAFERARLRALGRDSLASRVEHVSVTQGDGIGFDVLSRGAVHRAAAIGVENAVLAAFSRRCPHESRQTGLSRLRPAPRPGCPLEIESAFANRWCVHAHHRLRAGTPPECAFGGCGTSPYRWEIIVRSRERTRPQGSGSSLHPTRAGPSGRPGRFIETM